jgi:hypothetical protein
MRPAYFSYQQELWLDEVFAHLDGLPLGRQSPERNQ